jgi:hypothetical protein
MLSHPTGFPSKSGGTFPKMSRKRRHQGLLLTTCLSLPRFQLQSDFIIRRHDRRIIWWGTPK